MRTAALLLFAASFLPAAGEPLAGGINSDRLYFLTLPYRNGSFDQTHGRQTILYDIDWSMQSDDQWHITITTIPDYRSDSVLFSVIEQNEITAARLLNETTITIPLPKQSGPITGGDQQPLWLRFKATAFKTTESATTQQMHHSWHAPRLTPHMAELQRKARLAERMADRAFYFGYDTNEDALK